MGKYKNPIDFVPPNSRLSFIKKTSEGTNCTAIYKCECGVEKEFCMNNVRRGKVMSCGCFQRESQSKRAKTHGLSNHPLFKIWVGIKVRCETEGRDNNPYYYDKGVSMCDEWKNNFVSFYNWALDNGWEKGMEIDKDVKAKELGVSALIYSPEMCSVITRKENCNNRSSNRILTFNGFTKNVTQWEEEMGLPNEVILQRLGRGWDTERSITTPLLKGKNKKHGVVSSSRQNG